MGTSSVLVGRGVQVGSIVAVGLNVGDCVKTAVLDGRGVRERVGAAVSVARSVGVETGGRQATRNREMRSAVHNEKRFVGMVFFC